MHISIQDLERLAKEKLDPSVFAFLSGGSQDEITLQENESAYQQLRLLPKVLCGIDQVDISLNLFDQTVQMPIVVAPMAFQKLCHPSGELETIKATEKAKTLMTVAGYTTVALEEIKQQSSLRPWFQSYFLKDRGLFKAMIALAESLEYSALVLTVDMPTYARRERELRHPLRENIFLPDFAKLKPALFSETGSDSAKLFSSLLDHAISWKDIEWLRENTRLPIILKGIMRSEEAVRSLEYGIDGIVVSNHGGRQLDTAPSPIYVLPKVVGSLEGKIPVFVDGGIRRGSDVLKALALGAKAVLVGRPVAWGLSVDGTFGVYRVLESLAEELKQAMLFCGCDNLEAIKSDLITRKNEWEA